MTYEQFWDGDNEMPRMYRKAYEIKQREADQNAWLQGAYVYHAIGALAPALKAFAKGSVKPYLEKPFGYEEKPLDIERREIKTKEQKSDKKARTWMEAWAINFNEKFDKNEKLTEKGDDADGRSVNSRN